jgi:2-iminobutanoate/2-iminopropanoate deaminase
MEKEVVYSTEAPKPIGPYSQAVWAGDTLFVSGQIALDPASGELIQGNIETETKAVLNNVIAILDKAALVFPTL